MCVPLLPIYPTPQQLDSMIRGLFSITQTYIGADNEDERVLLYLYDQLYNLSLVACYDTKLDDHEDYPTYISLLAMLFKVIAELFYDDIKKEVKGYVDLTTKIEQSLNQLGILDLFHQFIFSNKTLYDAFNCEFVAPSPSLEELNHDIDKMHENCINCVKTIQCRTDSEVEKDFNTNIDNFHFNFLRLLNNHKKEVEELLIGFKNYYANENFLDISPFTDYMRTFFSYWTLQGELFEYKTDATSDDNSHKLLNRLKSPIEEYSYSLYNTYSKDIISRIISILIAAVFIFNPITNNWIVQQGTDSVIMYIIPGVLFFIIGLLCAGIIGGFIACFIGLGIMGVLLSTLFEYFSDLTVLKIGSLAAHLLVTVPILYVIWAGGINRKPKKSSVTSKEALENTLELLPEVIKQIEILKSGKRVYDRMTELDILQNVIFMDLFLSNKEKAIDFILHGSLKDSKEYREIHCKLITTISEDSREVGSLIQQVKKLAENLEKEKREIPAPITEFLATYGE